MTLDEFLTLTLSERIAWLHSPEGPRGYLSHDDFAEILGTSRQAVIKWEKDGVEPKKFASALAAFSGFPSEVFSRRGAEALVQEMIGRRLGELAADLAETTRELTQVGERVSRLEARPWPDEDQATGRS